MMRAVRPGTLEKSLSPVTTMAGSGRGEAGVGPEQECPFDYLSPRSFLIPVSNICWITCLGCLLVYAEKER